MAFREISVNEIREVLRLWLGTPALPAPGSRKIAEHAGWTVRPSVGTSRQPKQVASREQTLPLR